MLEVTTNIGEKGENLFGQGFGKNMEVELEGSGGTTEEEEATFDLYNKRILVLCLMRDMVSSQNHNYTAKY